MLIPTVSILNKVQPTFTLTDSILKHYTPDI